MHDLRVNNVGREQRGFHHLTEMWDVSRHITKCDGVCVCVFVCECARKLKIVQMQLGAVPSDKINSTIPQVSGSGEAL